MTRASCRLQLDNVLLATDADGRVSVKICDFGYSKSEPACNTRCGTPEYMAPEASPSVDSLEYQAQVSRPLANLADPDDES